MRTHTLRRLTLVFLPCALGVFLYGCGGGSSGGTATGSPTTIFLSRLYTSSAGSKTFRVTPPGDGTGDYVETLPNPPVPCAPGGNVNLVSTNILDRQFVSGRHERIYVSVVAGTTVSIKGSWIATAGAGGNGNFAVFNPPASFSDLMTLNVPIQQTGRVHQQLGAAVPFAGNECGDFTGGVDTGAYDFIYAYTGTQPLTVPQGSFPTAFKLDRNEILPTGTRTIASQFGGGLGELFNNEGGVTSALLQAN